MIREASSHLMNKLFALVSPTWLQPPHRFTLLDRIIIPYLNSLEFHLSSSFYPPLLITPLESGRPGTSLSPASAAATTCLAFIGDLFPNTLGPGIEGGMSQRFPKSAFLRREVETRPNISKWIEGGGRDKDWTRLEWGRRDFVQQMADKFDNEIGNGPSFFVR